MLCHQLQFLVECKIELSSQKFGLSILNFFCLKSPTFHTLTSAKCQVEDLEHPCRSTLRWIGTVAAKDDVYIMCLFPCDELNTDV